MKGADSDYFQQIGACDIASGCPLRAGQQCPCTGPAHLQAAKMQHAHDIQVAGSDEHASPAAAG